MKEIQRTYRYRLYPTRTQREQLAREFGCARFVWNWSLKLRNKAWKRRQERHTNVSVSRILTRLKRSARYAWLNDVTATCLIQKLRDQDNAYAHFFAGRAKFPRHKKKGHADAVRYQLDQRHVHHNFIPGKTLRLPKLGNLKLRWSTLPRGVPKMATVRRDPAGRYFVSLSVLEQVEPLPATDQEVGIDMGFRDVVTTSDGLKTGPSRPLTKTARRLARAQRTLARRQTGSGRYKRQRQKVARLYAKAADARHDFLHKLSARLISENQAISIEDLCVKGMARGLFGKAVGEAGLRALRRQLEYKAAWYGRDLVVIDRFAPSSKRCSDCGHVLETLEMNVRRWDCPACGGSHDRDVNAARNILYFARTARRAGTDARGEPHKSKLAA